MVHDEGSRCPNSGLGGLPDIIIAVGRTRTVSRHLREETHSGVTEERIEYVLNNWVLRGIRTEDDGRQSTVYLAFVSDLDKMMRVAISMDDRIIVTAFPDSMATLRWNRGDHEYFVRRYRDLEVRDAGSL